MDPCNSQSSCNPRCRGRCSGGQPLGPTHEESRVSATGRQGGDAGGRRRQETQGGDAGGRRRQETQREKQAGEAGRRIGRVETQGGMVEEETCGLLFGFTLDLLLHWDSLGAARLHPHHRLMVFPKASPPVCFHLPAVGPMWMRWGWGGPASLFTNRIRKQQRLRNADKPVVGRLPRQIIHRG
ncbi:unnamed protein product [Arctogadus glacialis]